MFRSKNVFAIYLSKTNIMNTTYAYTSNSKIFDGWNTSEPESVGQFDTYCSLNIIFLLSSGNWDAWIMHVISF